MITRNSVWWLLPLAVLQSIAHARGVTPYLPLNLDPEVERQVERVLVLADKPVLTRPIPAAVVLDALPKACQVDKVLCEHVRKFLSRYMRNGGVEFASLQASAAQGSSNTVIPNEHGEAQHSHYEVAGSGYWQLGDYALINAGGVAYEGRGTPTGSMISLGFDRAQLDIGYRDHWWSPMTDSAALISTEAATMPSATLSNYVPLTRLGFQYEAFLSRMSYSKKIELTNGQLTSGYPKFAGLHLGIEPQLSGWSFGANRVLVFGGGAAGGQSVSDILNAFFNPSKSQSAGFANRPNIAKQEASLTSRFVFPGAVPFAVYCEYAANDTSRGKNYLFGKPILSAGIHFPRVGPFDITYEISNWDITWYVNGFSPVQNGYGDGIDNYGRVIGGWFGDQRQFGDAIGGKSNMLKVGWEPPFGGLLETQYRLLVNNTFPATVPYRHEYMGSVSYSYPWRGYAVGTEIDAGRDVFGAHYTRLAGFIRYGDALQTSSEESADDSLDPKRPDGAEVFADVGANANREQIDLTSDTPRYQAPASYGPHLGVGARRAVSRHQDLGVRLEADEIRSHAVVGLRLIDYRYRLGGPLALTGFLGAARYSVAATPAYGAYIGTGAQWREILPGWDLGFDYRYYVELARQRVLPTDPQGGYRPDAFYNINSVVLFMSRKF
jgi:hypothetical protein